MTLSFKHLLPAALLLTACNTGSSPANTTGNTTNVSLITQVITPICASTLRDQDIVPQQARNLGIDEAAVCECGVRRVESKIAANPGRLLTVLSSTDAQIQLISELGTECTQELLVRALGGQPNTGATPFPGSTPFPTRTPEPIPTAPPR